MATGAARQLALCEPSIAIVIGSFLRKDSSLNEVVSCLTEVSESAVGYGRSQRLHVRPHRFEGNGSNGFSVDSYADYSDFPQSIGSYLQPNLGKLVSSFIHGFSASILGVGQLGTGASAVLFGQPVGSQSVFSSVLDASFARLGGIARHAVSVLSSGQGVRQHGGLAAHHHAQLAAAATASSVYLSAWAVTADDVLVDLLALPDSSHVKRGSTPTYVRVQVSDKEEAIQVLRHALDRVQRYGPSEQSHVFAQIELEQPYGFGTLLPPVNGQALETEHESDSRGRTCISTFTIVEPIGVPTMSGPTTATARISGRAPYLSSSASSTDARAVGLTRQHVSLAKYLRTLAGRSSRQTTAQQIQAQSDVARRVPGAQASFTVDTARNYSDENGLLVRAKGGEIQTSLLPGRPEDPGKSTRDKYREHERDTALSRAVSSVFNPSRYLLTVGCVSLSQADSLDTLATLETVEALRGIPCQAARADMIHQLLSPHSAPLEHVSCEEWAGMWQAWQTPRAEQQQEPKRKQTSDGHSGRLSPVRASAARRQRGPGAVPSSRPSPPSLSRASPTVSLPGPHPSHSHVISTNTSSVREDAGGQPSQPVGSNAEPHQAARRESKDSAISPFYGDQYAADLQGLHEQMQETMRTLSGTLQVGASHLGKTRSLPGRTAITPASRSASRGLPADIGAGDTLRMTVSPVTPSPPAHTAAASALLDSAHGRLSSAKRQSPRPLQDVVGSFAVSALSAWASESLQKTTDGRVALSQAPLPMHSMVGDDYDSVEAARFIAGQRGRRASAVELVARLGSLAAADQLLSSASSTTGTGSGSASADGDHMSDARGRGSARPPRPAGRVYSVSGSRHSSPAKSARVSMDGGDQGAEPHTFSRSQPRTARESDKAASSSPADVSTSSDRALDPGVTAMADAVAPSINRSMIDDFAAQSEDCSDSDDDAQSRRRRLPAVLAKRNSPAASTYARTSSPSRASVRSAPSVPAGSVSAASSPARPQSEGSASIPHRSDMVLQELSQAVRELTDARKASAAVRLQPELMEGPTRQVQAVAAEVAADEDALPSDSRVLLLPQPASARESQVHSAKLYEAYTLDSRGRMVRTVPVLVPAVPPQAPSRPGDDKGRKGRAPGVPPSRPLSYSVTARRSPSPSVAGTPSRRQALPTTNAGTRRASLRGSSTSPQRAGTAVHAGKRRQSTSGKHTSDAETRVANLTGRLTDTLHELESLGGAGFTSAAPEQSSSLLGLDEAQAGPRLASGLYVPTRNAATRSFDSLPSSSSSSASSLGETSSSVSAGGPALQSPPRATAMGPTGTAAARHYAATLRRVLGMPSAPDTPADLESERVRIDSEGFVDGMGQAPPASPNLNKSSALLAGSVLSSASAAGAPAVPAIARAAGLLGEVVAELQASRYVAAQEERQSERRRLESEATYQQRIDRLAKQLQEQSRQRAAADARARALAAELQRAEQEKQATDAQVHRLLRTQASTLAQLEANSYRDRL